MNRTSVGKWVIDPNNLPTAKERTQDETDTTLLTCLWGFDEEALDELWELHLPPSRAAWIEACRHWASND